MSGVKIGDRVAIGPLVADRECGDAYRFIRRGISLASLLEPNDSIFPWDDAIPRLARLLHEVGADSLAKALDDVIDGFDHGEELANRNAVPIAERLVATLTGKELDADGR